jgi:hypothetical protein
VPPRRQDDMQYRRRITWVATTVALLALTGCSAGGSTRSSAETTATRFSQAIADGDGAGACALLVRDARQAVEDRTRTSCERGVLRLDLPRPAAPASASASASARVYGRAAIVDDGRDILFLARSGDTWLVRAAGCTPEKDAPYDCTLDGS